MINIHLYKKTYFMPEAWSELTEEQILAVRKIINKPEIDFNDKVYLLKICLGMSDRSFITLNYFSCWLTDRIFWKKNEILLFLGRSVHLVDFLLNMDGQKERASKLEADLKVAGQLN